MKRFLSGVATSYLYIIVTSLVALWLTPYTLSFVSKTQYGYYILLADILTWINLLQFGVAGVFNSKAAMCIGKGDYETLQRYTSTAQIMQFASSLLILVCGIILTFFIDDILDTSGLSRYEVIVTFLIVVLTSVISVLKQPLSAILIANKQIHIDNLLQLGLFIVQVSLTVLFLNLGYNIVSLASSHLIAIVIIALITFLRVKKLPFHLNLVPRTLDRQIFFEMLSIGVWFSIGSLGQILIYKVDKFMVGKYISLGMVTSYYITCKLFDLASMFYSNFINIARPYFSHHYAKGEITKLGALYDLFLNSSILLLVFGCTLIYIINPLFISWWIRDAHNVYLGDTICFLVTINIILQSSILPNRALLASTLFKVKYQALTRVIEGVLKFIICLILIETYGIAGLLIGSIIACILCSTISMNYLSNKNLGRGVKHQLLNYLPYVSVTIPVIVYILPSRLYGLVFLLVSYSFLIAFVWKKIPNDVKTQIVPLLKNRR